jgi:hypothetical protein
LYSDGNGLPLRWPVRGERGPLSTDPLLGPINTDRLQGLLHNAGLGNAKGEEEGEDPLDVHRLPTQALWPMLQAADDAEGEGSDEEDDLVRTLLRGGEKKEVRT